MNFRKYAGIILNILVPLLTVYLVCVWGLRLVVFFLPFVIGWIVAAIANPVVRFFEKRLKIVRRHGSMVLIAGVLALVIFGIYALFSWVFREMTEFGQALPGIYASIREEVDLACERIGGLLKYLPADTETTIVSELENVGGYIGDFVQKIAASAGSRVVRTLPEVFVNTIIVFPIPSRFDRILIPKISPITKSTPHNGAKIFANAFRSYLINFPNILRPLLCIHLCEMSHGTGHRWICHFLLLNHRLTCM